MIWYAVELIPDDPATRFSPEALIGKIRVGDDDSVHFFFDRPPPEGARARLVPISENTAEVEEELPADYWDGCPPEIDFDATADAERAVKRMRGRRT